MQVSSTSSKNLYFDPKFYFYDVYYSDIKFKTFIISGELNLKANFQFK